MFNIAATTQRLFSLGFLVILSIFAGNIIFGDAIIQSSVKPTVATSSYDSLLADSAETIALLDENIWTSLTIQGKDVYKRQHLPCGK